MAENQRCMEPAYFLPKINFAGFLAAVPGSSKDIAALGKQPFFCCLILQLEQLQKPQVMDYHKG